MSKNILYNYINAHLSKLKKNYAITSANNIYGVPYFRIELPNTSPSLKDKQHQYALINHHISVYCNEDTTNTALSQYHYTGSFLDEEGETYQLHVYYNNNDELVSKPVFSKLNRDTNTYELIDNGNLNNIFISLSQSMVTPILSLLRKQLSDLVKVSESNYISAEQKLSKLYESLPAKLEEYKIALKNTKACLENLISLVNHSKYSHELTYLQKLEANLNTNNTQVSGKNNIQVAGKKTKKKASKGILTKANNQSSKNADVKSQPTLNSNSVTTNTAKSSNLNVIDKVTSILEGYYTLDIEKKVELILQIHQQVDDLLLFYVKKNDQIQQLKLLDKKINNLGADLLDELINQLINHKKLNLADKKSNNPGADLLKKLAEQLKPFHYNISMIHLVDALKNRDDEVLDFILTNGDFSVNNQQFKIGKTSYPSPVHYCFWKDSAATPMGDCLDVLLKHGASILLKDNSDFPLCFNVITDKNHRFYPIFQKNSEKILSSGEFYRQLLADLKFQLYNSEITETVKNQIESAIFSCKEMIKLFSSLAPNSKIIVKNLISPTLLEDPFIKKLIEDPFLKEPIEDLFNILIQLVGNSGNYKKKFSQFRFKQIMFDADSLGDIIQQLASKHDRSDYDSFKKNIAVSIKEVTLLLSTMGSLYDQTSALGKNALDFKKRKPNTDGITNLMFNFFSCKSELLRLMDKYNYLFEPTENNNINMSNDLDIPKI